MELLEYLFRFLKDLRKVLYLNKRLYAFFVGIIHTRYLFNDLPLHLNVDTLPKLTFKSSFLGPTDYLDRITVKDVSRPIMIGVDDYHRPFITFKYTFFDKKKKEKYYHVNTYFKRYTNLSSPWVIGACYPSKGRIVPAIYPNDVNLQR